MTIQKAVTDMNNVDKGFSCLCISCLSIILIYIGLSTGGYYTKSTNPGEYDFRFLIEKYIFYAGFISTLMGASYLYGDIEKDFNKIAIISIVTFIVMDLRAVDNLLSILIV